MDVPQGLKEARVGLTDSRTELIQIRWKIDRLKEGSYRYSEFFPRLDDIREKIIAATDSIEAAESSIDALSHDISLASSYAKDFDLYPGDRIRITMPAQEPFPAGWAEGTVISAHWYSDTGWYVEFEKERVSSGWQTGYGYWKQREDGGTVEKVY